MHPRLDRPHPNCQQVIDDLNNCHVDKPYAKFWGACNDQKAALDKCFAMEKKERRKIHLLEARERDRRFRERMKQTQEKNNETK